MNKLYCLMQNIQKCVFSSSNSGTLIAQNKIYDMIKKINRLIFIISLGETIRLVAHVERLLWTKRGLNQVPFGL
jgi:hypothetical protein